MYTSFKEKPLRKMIGMLATGLSVPMIRLLHFGEAQLERLDS